MFLVRFCCANERDTNESSKQIRFALDPNSNLFVDKKLQKLKGVMIVYLNFEKSLGTDEVDVIKLVEIIMTSFHDNQIPKKDLQQIYNKLPGLKMKNIKKILTQ